MIKKITLYLFILTICMIPKFGAIAVLQDENNQLENGETICSNQEYILFDEGNEEYKNLSLYENNYFLEEYQTNGSTTSIIIPNDVKNVSMVLTNGTDDLDEEFNFVVEDCSNEEIKNPYDIKTLNSDILISDGTLKFNLNHELEDYSLIYSTPTLIEGEEVVEGTEIVLEYPQIIQLSETYQQEGQTVTNFYEISISSEEEYKIREVNSLDITPKGIKPISNKYIFYIVILVILFLIFRGKEKKYKRRRRRLKEKRRRKIKHSKRKKNVKR